MSKKYNKIMTKAQLSEKLNISRSTLYLELDLYENGRKSRLNDVFDNYFDENYDALKQCINQVNTNKVFKDNNNHYNKVKIHMHDYFQIYTELYPDLARLMIDIYNKNVNLGDGLKTLDDMLKNSLKLESNS